LADFFTGLACFAALVGVDALRLAGADFLGAALFPFLADGFFAGGFFADGFLGAGFAAFVPAALAGFFGTGLAGFFAVDRLAALTLVPVRPDAAFPDPAVFCGDAIGNSQVAARGDDVPPTSPGSAG
jgi:hypothetical protein